mgnify:CR=1 FL=1
MTQLFYEQMYHQLQIKHLIILHNYSSAHFICQFSTNEENPVEKLWMSGVGKFANVCKSAGSSIVWETLPRVVQRLDTAYQRRFFAH